MVSRIGERTFPLMLATFGIFLKNFLPQPSVQLVHNDAPPRRPPLQPLGLDDFLNLDIPPRKMLLSPDPAGAQSGDALCAEGCWQDASWSFNWPCGCKRESIFPSVHTPSTPSAVCRRRDAIGVVARTVASHLAWIKRRISNAGFRILQPTTWQTGSISALSKDSVRWSRVCWTMLTC